jgi:hypothetical protein
VLFLEGAALLRTDEAVPVLIEFDEAVAGNAPRVRLADPAYYQFFTS